MRKSVLIIEDDKRVLDILAFVVGREGYTVFRCTDGLEGIQLAEERAPDLIVLDLDTSPMSNMEVCRSLREENITAPILVCTPSDQGQDEILNVGADDCIQKPFAMKELLLKIRTNTWHLNGGDMAGSARLQVLGRIAIDQDQLKVMKDGVVLDLTQREFDLISFLAEKPGRVHTREELMHSVWEYTGFLGDVRAVDVSIRRLREKIEDDPANPTIIITKRGRGYFLAPDGK